MNDPIVDEVRRVRDAYAAQFNYELDAIFADLKEQEKQSGLEFVCGAAKRARPNQSPEATGPAVAVSDNSQLTEAGLAAGR